MPHPLPLPIFFEREDNRYGRDENGEGINASSAACYAKRIMNKDSFSSFFEATQLVFSFLETEYGYRWVSSDAQDIDYFPDTIAFVRYVSKKVGVEVHWYPAGGGIDAALIALLNGWEFPPKRRFLSDERGEANAISLHTLADMLGQDDLYLLNKWPSTKLADVKKRVGIINESMTAVLENVASILHELAHDVLLGDTSVFPKVQEHAQELVKKLYP